MYELNKTCSGLLFSGLPSENRNPGHRDRERNFAKFKRLSVAVHGVTDFVAGCVVSFNERSERTKRMPDRPSGRRRFLLVNMNAACQMLLKKIGVVINRTRQSVKVGIDHCCETGVLRGRVRSIFHSINMFGSGFLRTQDCPPPPLHL